MDKEEDPLSSIPILKVEDGKSDRILFSLLFALKYTFRSALVFVSLIISFFELIDNIGREEEKFINGFAGEWLKKRLQPEKKPESLFCFKSSITNVHFPL